MERKTLESVAANYPYLQGLWALPMGFLILLAGLSNLQRRPDAPLMLGILGGGLCLCLVGCRLIARYYREHYGEVTPTRSRQVKQAVAIVAGGAVLFVGANKFLFWSLDSPVCVYAAAFALATLVYYAILVGLRAHHVVIWGALLVAGLLPIWGGLGQDRDAVAMFPLGVALIASGLLDQRLLGRAFGSSERLNFENSHVGG